MEFYNLINDKFEKILSGECLTSIREENKRIAKSHNLIEESNFIKLRGQFIKYIKNYLYLKGYKIVDENENSIIAELNDQKLDFLIEFDWQNTDEDTSDIKLKILDKGVKSGISSFEGKYLFIVSVKKGLIYLMNSDNLKKQIKENRDQFKILSETTELFKTQFVNFDPSELNQKIKIFSIK